MHRRLKGFDFRQIQTAGIGVTWPCTLAILLENYSKYFDDFTCWLVSDSCHLGCLFNYLNAFVSITSGQTTNPAILGHYNSVFYPLFVQTALTDPCALPERSKTQDIKKTYLYFIEHLRLEIEHKN